jgi:hypothetical protein
MELAKEGAKDDEPLSQLLYRFVGAEKQVPLLKPRVDLIKYII